MKESKEAKAKNTGKFTNDEREWCIRQLERASGKPYSRFCDLGRIWIGAFEQNRAIENRASRRAAFDRRYEDLEEKRGERYACEAEEDVESYLDEGQTYVDDCGTEQEMEKFELAGSEYVGPLDDEVLCAITKIFRSGDDDLKSHAINLVMDSVRYLIVRIMMRYTSQSQEREEFLSEAFLVVLEALPSYDVEKGKLSTWIEDRLKKAFGEKRRDLDQRNGTRYYGEVATKISRAEEWILHNKGINDPSPEMISAVSENIFGKPLSVSTIINCREQQVAFSSYDDAYAQLSEQATDAWNPEDAYMAKDQHDQVQAIIDSLEPMARDIVLSRLECFDRTGTELALNTLVNQIRQKYPSATATQIRNVRAATDTYFIERLSGYTTRREQVYAGGPLLSREALEQEAATLTGAVDLLDLDYLFDDDE